MDPEQLAAAEAERYTLLAQAARIHLENIAAESRRYQSEMADIQRVYLMRLGKDA